MTAAYHEQALRELTGGSGMDANEELLESVTEDEDEEEGRCRP